MKNQEEKIELQKKVHRRMCMRDIFFFLFLFFFFFFFLLHALLLFLCLPPPICLVLPVSTALVLASLFNKVAGLKARKFINMILQHKCFLVNLTKFFRAALSIEHLRWLLLYSPLELMWLVHFIPVVSFYNP